jgi:hypothetical protein
MNPTSESSTGVILVAIDVAKQAHHEVLIEPPEGGRQRWQSVPPNTCASSCPPPSFGGLQVTRLFQFWLAQFCGRRAIAVSPNSGYRQTVQATT